MLFVHCRAHRRLRANTSGKIKRFSGCYYPRRYGLHLFRTAGCSCNLRNINRNSFWEKHFRWHNPSLGRRDRDSGEETTNLDTTESPSKVLMCGVSIQQQPSTQITLFERTRQSAWLDAVTTPLTRSNFVPIRGIVTFIFSPRNLTQVTSTMKPGQDSMFGFSSVKRITLREGLY